jgi:hypothetical protein
VNADGNINPVGAWSRKALRKSPSVAMFRFARRGLRHSVVRDSSGSPAWRSTSVCGNGTRESLCAKPATLLLRGVDRQQGASS